MRHVLVVATHNRGKLGELRALLSDLDVEIVPLRDVLGRELVVVEDGATFEANAIKKARAAFEATTMLTLADDSGLEVDALGGAPGVHSARYAGEHATDADNNAKLLAALANEAPGSGDVVSKARFRCVLALIDPYWNQGAVRRRRRLRGPDHTLAARRGAASATILCSSSTARIARWRKL